MTVEVRVKESGRTYELADRHRDIVWVHDYNSEKPIHFLEHEVEPVVESIETLSKGIGVSVKVKASGLTIIEFRTKEPRVMTLGLGSTMGLCFWDQEYTLPMKWSSIEVDKITWESVLVFTVPQPDIIVRNAVYKAIRLLEDVPFSGNPMDMELGYRETWIELNEAMIAMGLIPSEKYSQMLKERSTESTTTTRGGGL